MGRHEHRKERWLHARISEDLEAALKREAQRRRTPVSLLVRNVLESAFALVEDIVEDGLAIARRSREFADTIHGRTRDDDTGPDGMHSVYGWQELILNRQAACLQCTAELAAGITAYRGLREQPSPPVFLCAACLRRLRSTTHAKREEPA